MKIYFQLLILILTQGCSILSEKNLRHPSSENSLECASALTPTEVKNHLSFVQSGLDLVRFRNEVGTAHNDLNSNPEWGPYIQAEVDPVFQTLRLFHRKMGRFNKGTQARVLILHGNGTTKSNSSAMRKTIRDLAEPGPGKSKSTIKFLIGLMKKMLL